MKNTIEDLISAKGIYIAENKLIVNINPYEFTSGGECGIIFKLMVKPGPWVSSCSKPHEST